MKDNLKKLISKYATSGPRYTSYPTAPYFSADADKKRLARAAVESDGALSLYMHVPFCRARCLFCGCSSAVCGDSSLADAYLDDIVAELELWRDASLGRRELKQIHFGGGTPNFLTPPQIARVGKILEKYFSIDRGNCEFSVELDPRTLERDEVQAFADIGVNRASLGIQDTGEATQRAIGRVQPMSKNIRSVEWLESCGIKAVNIDLMYGLPLQTAESFRRTVADALSLSPARIALFGYAHVPWIKPAQKALEKFAMPSPEVKVELFLEGIEAFENAGYEYVGLDHFAKPDDPLILARANNTLHRNFQGYSTRAGLDSFAIGLTSISETKISYRQNFKDMPAYRKSISEGRLPIERGIVLDGEDILRRGVIMDVMCSLKVFFNRYGVNFAEKFGSALEKLKDMETDGLVKIHSDHFEVTPLGRLFLRNIAMLFDEKLGAGAPRYSKTV